MNGLAAPQVGFIDLSSPLPVGAIDLSGDEPRIVGFEEDAQEPVGEPVAETGADGPLEAATAVDEAPVKPEPEEKTADREPVAAADDRSEEHTSELQSLMRNSYAVFCLKKKKKRTPKKKNIS